MTVPDLTERELDVMAVLWARASATTGEIQSLLEDDLAYTTVLSVLQTLELKGVIGHVKEGRAFRYHPLVKADAAAEAPLARLLDRLFQGSPVRLLANVLERQKVSREDVRRMRNMLRRMEEGAE